MTEKNETARLVSAPRRPAGAGVDERWLSSLDVHAMEHGFHARLGAAHGALYTEDDESLLLVSFETAGSIRAVTPALPFGLSVAGKEGWSQLTLYSDGETWFRDPEVYAFFDDLVDDGFFDLFDNVLFYGVASGGYAACAYSVAAPGARVLAIRPQATLSPARAGWDKRFPNARRLSFTDRYGDASLLLDAAEEATIVYDPGIVEDAMHATLLSDHAQLFRTPFLGPEPEAALADIGILERMVRLAARRRLTRAAFADLWRHRRSNANYLGRVLDRLEGQNRADLQAMWCRGAQRQIDHARFRQGRDLSDRRLAASRGAVSSAG